MTALAWWLLSIGLCDLVRATRDLTSVRRRVLICTLGVSLLLIGALGGGISSLRGVPVVLPWVVCLLAWVLGSAAAVGQGGPGRPGGPVRPDGSGPVRDPARTVAFLGLGLGVVISLAYDESSFDLPLPGTLLGYGEERVLLLLGVALVQLSTANLLVRLILDAVGVPAAAGEKTLKGGRMLGPMERLTIVTLGLAGQSTAAAIVVAAKGLLRFPELQSSASGPSEVNEYFLIGSFASWLCALAGLGVLAV